MVMAIEEDRFRYLEMN